MRRARTAMTQDGGGSPQVVAVGDNGEIVYYTGSGFSTAASTTGLNLSGAVYSPELMLWVAVGNDGRIRNSTNGGATWSDTNLAATTNDLTDVAWSPSLGRFVACANVGTFYTSSNGTSWASATIAANDYRTVTWAPELGLFIMAGIGSVIYTSTTGASGSFTSRTNPLTHDWLGGAWGSGLGRFMLVGQLLTQAGSISSTAGTTWASAGTNGTVNTYDVAYSPTLNIFVRTEISGVRISTNGTSWGTAIPMGQSATNFTGITWSTAHRKFFAVGYRTSASTSYIYSSVDGSTWVQEYANSVVDPLRSIQAAA